MLTGAWWWRCKVQRWDRWKWERLDFWGLAARYLEWIRSIDIPDFCLEPGQIMPIANSMEFLPWHPTHAVSHFWKHIDIFHSQAKQRGKKFLFYLCQKCRSQVSKGSPCLFKALSVKTNEVRIKITVIILELSLRDLWSDFGSNRQRGDIKRARRRGVSSLSDCAKRGRKVSCSSSVRPSSFSLW